VCADPGMGTKSPLDGSGSVLEVQDMFWRSWLTDIGTWTASPVAFAVVALYGLSWLILSPETLEWHGLATLITWMMTLFIQRAEHRDTQAIHGKLDELLHVHSDAKDEVTRLDEKEPEQIERFRASRESD
jgi:low affinity Fe/Cu permease